MISGVHHVALAVPDLEAALAFYCDLIGFEVVMQAEVPSGVDAVNEAFGIADAGCRVRMLSKGNSRIELFEFKVQQSGEEQRPVNQTGITHFALASDDPVADYHHLAEHGVVFNAPLLGQSPARFAYGRDPFGNVIELLEHEPAGAGG